MRISLNKRNRIPFIKQMRIANIKADRLMKPAKDWKLFVLSLRLGRWLK